MFAVLESMGERQQGSALLKGLGRFGSTLLYTWVLLLVGCSNSESVGYPSPESELSLHRVEIGPDGSSLSRDLHIRVEAQTALSVAQGDRLAHLVLSQEEVDELIALFSEDRRGMYEDDERGRADTAIAPDCVDTEDGSEAALVCRALVLASPKVFIRFTSLPNKAINESDPAYLLIDPMMMTVEMAELIVVLEELRLRVLEDGDATVLVDAGPGADSP